MKRVKAFIFIFMVLCFIISGKSFAQEVRTVPINSEIAPSTLPSISEGTSTSALEQDVMQKITEASEGQSYRTEQVQSPGAGGGQEPGPSVIEQFISGKLPSGISTDIKQFGYDLFANPPSTFTPTSNVPVGPDYVVGPGDEIRVTVWGNVEARWNVFVDRDGNISLPKIGVIGVTGLKFSELRDLLKKELSKYYTGFDMNVSMGSLRSIRVYVVGNVRRPGAYTVSAISTLVNALMESGGPSKTGTMRDIQLKRNSHTVVHFDIYDFLLRGDKSRDVRLMPEDVIFVPPVGPLAGIAGNVKNPAIYELKGETRLLDLINMAGGLTSTAFTGRVQVQRIEQHRFRTLFEGDLIDIENSPDKNFLLEDGDLVKVFSVTIAKNTVNISGAIVNPGEYAIVPGVTLVSDVIEKAGGTLYYASDKAELTRVKITKDGPRTELLQVNISKALEGDPANNIPLEINDYLFVRTVPEWKLYQTVSISGEVKFPGTYTIRKGETLSSLIERAGGYTDRAYLRGAVFTRKSVRALQKKALDEMIERLERELFAIDSARVSAAFSSEELAARKLELEQKRLFIESLKKLEVNGRMAIRLAHLRLLKNSEYDIELEEGDSLHIPVKSSVINVAGAVMSRGSFVYSERLDYKDYINMAGGYTDYADEGKVYVLKVDGTAWQLARGFLNWNSSRSRWEVSAFADDMQELEPGDTIVVPEKLERIAWMRNIKDLTQILYQVAVTAGVLIVAF
jgi:protein involved in polysaccharide export with SLBB domain